MAKAKGKSKATIRSKRGKAWDPARLKQTQLAALLGVTAPAITRWSAKGCPRNADKSYDLAAVCQWLRHGAMDIHRLPQTLMLQILDVAKPTIAEFAKRGCPRNADKTYDAVAVVAWRTAELEQRIRDARKLGPREAAQSRKAIADAEMRQLDLAERHGELLPRKAVIAGWTARYQTVKSSLLGLLGRLKGRGFDDAQLELLRTEIRTVISRFGAGQIALKLTAEQAAVLAELCNPTEAEPEARP